MSPSAKQVKAIRDISRMRVFVRGAVQGVGFRPFVYRLATEMNLLGWVNNSSSGVTIEVEGEPSRLRGFLRRLDFEKPPRASIQSLESSFLDAVGLGEFEIRPSDDGGAKTAVVMPDISTCPDCLAEIADPTDRRYRYPFTNCTNCGPRYSIIEALPYDRPNTSMRTFTMCAECSSEYHDPRDRRFHAQPNACPACGPKLELWNGEGLLLASQDAALMKAADAVRKGKVVAVKGLGGFHLIVDAANDAAIQRLRHRKHRYEKPLALMMPTLKDIELCCELSDSERYLLESPERPIVILKAKFPHGPISHEVTPGNPYLGCMLPYTPLHHLLMNELGFAVVATSGNLSDEPICIDEGDASKRLNGIADFFLVHDRKIVRPVDDSILRVMVGREMVIRRARGFAPLPVPRMAGGQDVLAVGAHLKNAVAASAENQTFISQHIGDLDTPEAFDSFKRVVSSLEGLYEIEPAVVACDKHPDYRSTSFSRSLGKPVVAVQHHYAHILSCMAENELNPPVLGVAWDGTGYGDDGTVWGGEFLKIGSEGYVREAHFRTFPLPGGDRAIREPRRSALGVLHELFGHDVIHKHKVETVHAFKPADLAVIENMIARKINSPRTSSVGRLFDAVASIIGLRHFAAFEGQAAMDLEFVISNIRTDESYRLDISSDDRGPIVVDWRPALAEIIADSRSGISAAIISARFHNMLAEVIVSIAERVGSQAVAISGGCFQNKYLLERTVQRLAEAGFSPYWHQRVPTNDGGIALGQTLAADMASESLRLRNTGRR